MEIDNLFKGKKEERPDYFLYSREEEEKKKKTKPAGQIPLPEEVMVHVGDDTMELLGLFNNDSDEENDAAKGTVNEAKNLTPI